MEKFREWRYAITLAFAAAGSCACLEKKGKSQPLWLAATPGAAGGVGLAFRRWRGRAGKTGFIVATAAGVTAWVVATKRWELRLDYTDHRSRDPRTGAGAS